MWSTDSLRTQSIEHLIGTRDKFLSECFDIESGRRFVIDAQDADDRLGVLRQRIDEIHEELARRDLEKLSPDTMTDLDAARGFYLEDEQYASQAEEPAAPAQARLVSPETVATYANDYLRRTEERMALLDALAKAAQDDGDLAQAARCTVHAHELDRDRIDFLTNASGQSQAGSKRHTRS